MRAASRSGPAERAARQNGCVRWDQPLARLRVDIDSPSPASTISLDGNLSMARPAAAVRGRRYFLRVGWCTPDPVVDEGAQPIARGQIVDRTVGDMLVALFGARQFHAMRATHEPAVHHCMRHFRVKLQLVTGTKAECLDGESVAFSQQLTSGRQI